MSFNIDISVDGAVDKITQHEQALDATAAATGRVRDAMGGLSVASNDAGDRGTAAMLQTASSAAAADDGVARLRATIVGLTTATQVQAEAAAEEAAMFEEMLGKGAASLERQADVLERIKGPMREYKADIEALGDLLDQGRISQVEYTTELERLIDAQGTMQGPLQQVTEEMQRQADTIERIKGPASDFRANVEALDAVFAKGQISAGEYTNELDRLIAKSGMMQGPIQQVSDEMMREATMLESIRGPMRQYQTDVDTLSSLLLKGAIDVGEYDAKLAQLGARAGVTKPLSDEMDRQTQIVERIRGPIREYTNDINALNALLDQGRISQHEYLTEMDKVRSKQAPKPQKEEGGGFLSDGLGAVAGKFGASGQILGGLALEGTIAAAAVVALATEMVHLGDAYIEVSNEARRFATGGLDVNTVLTQQYDLSVQLHAGLEQTMKLYAGVREGTEDLNLSQAQQLDLTREIGDAVVASGKSVDQAGGMMRRLSFAFASGTISGRELKQIMREFPEIGDGFVSAMGHSRKELIDMANKGQISADMLIGAFDKMGPAMADKVGKRAETTGQMWQHFTDTLTISVGKMVESSGVFKLIGAVLDGVGKAVAFVADAFSFLGSLLDSLGPAVSPLVVMFESMKVAAEIAGAITDAVARAAPSDFAEKQNEIAKAYINRMEALKLLGIEEEKNERTAKIATAASKLGIDIGPFDEEAANKMAELRITMRQSGIVIADSFDTAHNKAALFNTQLDKMKESSAAAKMAADVKRVWESMDGVNETIDAQMKKWRDVSDQITTITGAITRWKSLTPAGTPTSQEQRDLERQKRDLINQQNLAQYGKDALQVQTGKDQAGDQIRDLQRALKAGEIDAESFRVKYDQLITTVNDGRLPETIKYWEQFHLPMGQFQRDVHALDSLMKSNSITVGQWRAELQKAAGTAGAGEIWNALDQYKKPIKPDSEGSARAINDAMLKQAQQQDAFGADAAINPGLHYEQTLRDITAATQRLGLSQQAQLALQDAARQSFESSAEKIAGVIVVVDGYAKALDRLRDRRQIQISAGVDPDQANQQFQAMAAQLVRARDLVAETTTPLATYRRALQDISAASHEFGLSQVYVASMTQTAKKAYEEAMDALDPVAKLIREANAPTKAFAEQTKLVDEAFARVGGLSAKQYAEQLDRIRAAYLANSDAGKSFLGGLEGQWIKAKAEAESFGATVAGQIVGDVDKLNQALVTAANGGAVSFRDMADSILQDLERIALKQLEVGVIGALGGGGGGSDVSLPGVGQTLAGFFSHGDASAGPVTSPSADAGQQSALRSASSRQTGPGAYPVPSAANNTSPPTSNTAPIVVQIHNHYDDSVGHSAINSRPGQQSIVNIMKANKSALK